MKALHINPAARRYLAAIWSYTVDAWQSDQADDYVASLNRAMQKLAEFPAMGSIHVSKVGTFRKFASGHHLIFYQEGAEMIEIVRILHQRMDVEGQLAASV